MDTLVLRLKPGEDLRGALEAVLARQAIEGAFVLAGIGSLSQAMVRRAGIAQADGHREDLELLTLSGSLSAQGAHLHATLARADGSVFGGHVAPGCIVRTTAEVLVGLLPGWTLERAVDEATGYAELVARRARFKT
jgi:uncharacterized protein